MVNRLELLKRASVKDVFYACGVINLFVTVMSQHCCHLLLFRTVHLVKESVFFQRLLHCCVLILWKSSFPDGTLGYGTAFLFNSHKEKEKQDPCRSKRMVLRCVCGVFFYADLMLTFLNIYF